MAREKRSPLTIVPVLLCPRPVAYHYRRGTCFHFFVGKAEKQGRFYAGGFHKQVFHGKAKTEGFLEPFQHCGTVVVEGEVPASSFRSPVSPNAKESERVMKYRVSFQTSDIVRRIQAMFAAAKLLEENPCQRKNRFHSIQCLKVAGTEIKTENVFHRIRRYPFYVYHR